jgi:hypothetical protein
MGAISTSHQQAGTKTISKGRSVNRCGLLRDALIPKADIRAFCLEWLIR